MEPTLPLGSSKTRPRPLREAFPIRMGKRFLFGRPPPPALASSPHLPFQIRFDKSLVA